MSLVVPDEVLRKSGMTESELLLEIAVLLFQKERLTLAQSSKVAGISQLELQRELAARKIPIHYDIKEFEDDQKALREAGFL